jgi:hypothetical protein
MRRDSGELSRVRWTGQGAYRALSYYFTVRWNRARLGAYVQHVLGPFAVPPDPRLTRNPPTPGLPPAYSLVELPRSKSGRFRLLYGNEPLLTSAKRDDVLHQLFWHINVESCWQTGDFVLIHAGAVVTPQAEGVLLPGQSGSGKTTLTAGLVRAGFGYLSDEAGVIDPVTRRLYPHAKTLNLKEGSVDLFAELDGNKWGPLIGEWYVPVDAIRPGAAAPPSPLRYVVAPRYRPGSPTILTPISRARTLATLWESSWNLSTYRGRAFHLLVDAMEKAQGFTLEYGNLDEAVNAVMTVTGRRRSRGRRQAAGS